MHNHSYTLNSMPTKMLFSIIFSHNSLFSHHDLQAILNKFDAQLLFIFILVYHEDLNQDH